MDKQKDRFIRGAKNNGHTEEFAIDLFDQIEKFAGYSFNKSHASSYALLSYCTAFLKYYFPAEFYSAIMKYEILKSPKESDFNDYLAECYEKNLDVVTPDINESGIDFSTNDGDIQYGLRSVKGVGSKAAKAIIDNRPYNDFEDFVEKTSGKAVDKTTVEGLIKAGAFDTINSNRKMLLNYYDFLNGNKDSNSMGMFTPKQIVGDEETSEEDIVAYESEVLRAAITHPTEWDTTSSGDSIRLKGYLENVKEVKDKRGKLMAFADLKLEYHSIDLVIFGSTYGSNRHIIEDYSIVKVQGKKDGNSLLLDKIKEVDEEDLEFSLKGEE